jgi:hypothetical protein
MLQCSSCIYVFISFPCHTRVFLVFRYPHNGSLSSTLAVMLPIITVLLHPYSPVLSPHAQSNADKLTLCHGYPQCHKTVTAQCHIIPSPPPPLLSLNVICLILYPQSFCHFSFTFCITHSSFITTQQTNSTQCNTQYPKPHFTSLLPT